MELRVSPELEIKKKPFKLNQKASLRDGLILRIYYTDSFQKLRFVFTSFDETGNLIASSDNNGNIFMVNIAACKFWGLPTVNSCTLLQFSTYKNCEILVGVKSNEILVVNFEIGVVTGKLIGHSNIPTTLTFSRNSFCLTSSKTEAIIWELQNNSKLKILTLEKGALLRYVGFLPNTNYIFGCYTDNIINIWEFQSFKIIRTIGPVVTNKLKNITFSSDGSLMCYSGVNPSLTIYSLIAWKVVKIIKLPEYIKSIRSIKFVSLNNSKEQITAVLSGDGVLSFIDIQENLIMSELKVCNEITKFAYSDQSNLLSCVLCSGVIEIHDVPKYIEKPVEVSVISRKKLKVKLNQKTSSKRIEEVKDEVNEVLSIDKLRLILKEYGEYPQDYRTMIWEQLLQLPYNRTSYGGIISNKARNVFPNLNDEYPLENRSLENLKVLLNKIAAWCGFFAEVQYLPVFVFPFISVFQNRPIACFEAIITILLNWCQYWFEYFPLPPINILAIIENVMLELDPELLTHLSQYDITSKQYAWSLLESAFSEVLNSRSWFVLWDHVLTNEPSFLLCAVVGYNIVLRNNILNITEKRELEMFHRRHNPLDVKKFIARCYSIMERKDIEFHPRKYLNMFRSLEKGIYPVFEGYPKVVIENETYKLNNLKKELDGIEIEEAKLLLERKKQIDKLLGEDLESIEKKRLFEMKKACNQKFQDQHIRAKQHLMRLKRLRETFDEHQKKVLEFSKTDRLQNRVMSTDLLRDEIETNCQIDEYHAEKSEGLLLRHHSELMKHKAQIEALLQEEDYDQCLHDTVRKKHSSILREMEKISETPDTTVPLKQYNIISSLIAIEDLIKKVEFALSKELSNEYLKVSKSENFLGNIQLQTETDKLEEEVNNLLNTLSKMKVDEQRNELKNVAKTSRKRYQEAIETSAHNGSSSSSAEVVPRVMHHKLRKKVGRRSISDKNVTFCNLKASKSF